MGQTTLRSLKKVRLVTELIGHDILWVRRTASTNDLAWAEAEKECREGMLVVAEEQTAGRGRLRRSWFCPDGKGFLASVVLRPTLPVEKAGLLTVIGALAVADVASALADCPARIRWPNDVILDGRKVAGVLVESRTLAGASSPTYVLGVGVNVSLREDDFPVDLRERATSLDLAARRALDRVDVARRWVEAFDGWYVRLKGGHLDEIAAAWHAASAVLKQRVEVRTGSETHVGTVEDVDPCEGIFLRLDRGGIRRFRGEHVECLLVL